MKVNLSLRDHMQKLKETQGNQLNAQSFRGHKSIKTEGNFEEKNIRCESSNFERNMTQVDESPMRNSLVIQNNPQRSGRSYSCASQKSSQNTQRDDMLGPIHSPNFAQNLEQISQRFEMYKNGGPILIDQNMYNKQNVPVQSNLRLAFEQKLSNAQNLQSQSQFLSHSRSNSSANENYNCSNMSVSTQNNTNRKRIFDSQLPPQPLKNNFSINQICTNIPVKSKPLNSSRVYSNSSNKENMKNLPNQQHFSQEEQYHSITSNSNRETDLEKANEKILYLEQNLHKEMLNSEEQRTQISILKNELERKLSEYGFMNFFKTGNSSQNLSHIDIYMELQVIKQKLLEKEEKLLVLQRDTEFQKIIQIKERSQELEQENQSLKDQIEVLRFDRNDLEDLKAEKSNLIDFIEKLKSENEKLEDELNEAEQKANRQQNTFETQQLKEQNDYLQEENKQKDQEIEQLNESLQQTELLKEQIENHRMMLIEQNKQLNEQMQEQKATIEKLQKEKNSSNSQLKEQNEELKQQISLLKDQIDHNNDQFSLKIEEFEKIIEQLQTEKQVLLDNDNKKSSEIQNYQEQIQNLKQSAQSNTFIQNQFESYKQKFEDAKDNIFTLTQTLEETNNELEKVQTKCANFEQIAKEKSQIINQKEEAIKELNEIIQNIEQENEQLKSKLQKEVKDNIEKQAQQFYSEKRNLSLQLEHQKSQNMIQEKKIQEMEVIIDKMRMELNNNHEGSENVQSLKFKMQQNIEYYEKKIKEMKQFQHSRRQELISLQVQVTMLNDISKSISGYIKERYYDDIEINHLVEDMEYQMEEIVNQLHGYTSSSQQQSTQITQRSSYQSLHQNMQFNTQHKSRDLEELKSILSMKDREIQALKKDQFDHQMGYPQQQQQQQQQYQKQERYSRPNEFQGGYYSGKGSKNYFS
ncbi:hypothetical protein TTHERM_01295290 (macronuclear) [Tetrahymena thermophila SB210]|uniref:Uncharacterized protein n=1 Tax=Tetrahymena thermophila (strain SB210) TaxID=312017 RepID=Q23VB6_TETTS|nr:hypothetical protein TTHERM_01295290 [Tetrahymena thermophila SB210]EAS00466.2 hypothetical protein TTHERM_01295290 [Tetrahymena thermophila SB210]|eukprot:XP_001020711.2 hypothetical protein TTHERM_01295290 [Tetrahymena thermophila SB210]